MALLAAKVDEDAQQRRVSEPRPRGRPAWPYWPPKLMKTRSSVVCLSHDREGDPHGPTGRQS